MEMTVEGWIAVAAIAPGTATWALDRLGVKIPKGIYRSVIILSGAAFFGAATMAVLDTLHPTPITETSNTKKPDQTVTDGSTALPNSHLNSVTASTPSEEPQQQSGPSPIESDTRSPPNRAPDFDVILSDGSPAHMGEVGGYGDQRFIGCAYKKAGRRDPYKQVMFGYLLGGFQPSGGTVQVGQCRNFRILATM